MMSEERAKQKVVCAANRKNGLIICGARHFDIVMREAIAKSADSFDSMIYGGWEQGFIDQFGKFLTREEAWKIAEDQGQIVRRCGGDGEKLFSENLY